MRYLLLTLAGFLLLTPAAFAETIHAEKVGDADLSCNEITQEISLMEGKIEQATAARRSANMRGAATDVGVSALSHFGSNLGLGSVFGLNDAAQAANQVTGMSVVEANELKTSAERRRSNMMALYKGKGCSLAQTEPAAGKSSRSFGND